MDFLDFLCLYHLLRIRKNSDDSDSAKLMRKIQDTPVKYWFHPKE